MEKSWNHIRQELHRGKNLEYNLPLYLTEMASAYFRLSSYNLASSYVILAENCADGTISLKSEGKNSLKSLRALIQSLVLDEFDAKKWETQLKELNKLRDTVIRRMDALTAYTDLFSVYDFVLRRLEPKVLEQQAVFDAGQESEQILALLFQDTDSVLLQERLRIVLSELPVRMTKTKFLAFVENTFDLYKESDAESVDLFCYMLRSAAGIYRPEEMERFTALRNYLEKLETCEFSALTKKEYKALCTGMEKVTKDIAEASDFYCELQDCINSLMIYALLYPYAEASAAAETAACRELLEYGVKEAFSEETADRIDTLFAGFEGKLEELVLQVEKNAAGLQEAEAHKELLQAMMLEKLFHSLQMAERLQAVSRFAPLTPPEVKQTEPSRYCAEKKKELTDELEAVLAGGKRELNRARMAMVLKELPVFQTGQEISDYVRTMLSSCKDEGEGMVSVREIKRQLEEF